MSMHLAFPNLTTTSTKKRKTKVTKAQQEDLERGWRDRNVRLKQMGLQKETFEQYLVWVYGKGKKDKTEKTNRTKDSPPASKKVVDQGKSNLRDNTKHIVESSSNNDNTTKQDDSLQTHGKIWVTGPCSTKQTPTYTGTKIIGIGTLHKSNAVPIFSNEEAIDISKMRR